MLNRKQVDNVIKATITYANAMRREWEDNNDINKLSPAMDAAEFHRAICAAYVSGVLATAEVLAAHDGFHPSKLAEAARIAGTEMTGSKPTRNT